MDMRVCDTVTGEAYEVWFVEGLYEYNALTGTSQPLASAKEGTAILINEITGYGDFLRIIDFEVALATGRLVEINQD